MLLHVFFTTYSSHPVKSTALCFVSQTSAFRSRMASKWGEEVLVPPKASLVPPVLHHCCLPEQCQQSLPGRAILTPTAGMLPPRRLRDNPSASGDVGPGQLSQTISLCIHTAAESQGSPLAGETVHTREESLCSSPAS